MPSSGGNPPIIGWSVISASAPAATTTSTQSSGVTTANCGLAFSSSTVSIGGYGVAPTPRSLAHSALEFVVYITCGPTTSQLRSGSRVTNRNSGPFGRGRRGTGLPRRCHLRGVHVVQLWRGRHEVVAVAGRPDRRRLRRAADVDRRTWLLHGRRQDLDRHPLVLERLTAPGSLQDADGLLENLDPLRLLDAEHRELVEPVADAQRELDATTADEVEHGQVLGQHDRIVEHREQRREVHRHPLRAGHHRRGQHDR